MDSKFIINLQGNNFVKHEGLLNEFHQNEGNEIRTEILSYDPVIVKATASGRVGTFEGIGDADENNVNRNIVPHKIRMAETRAINRALRLYNNIGMCSAEELGEMEPKKEPKEQAKQNLWVKIRNEAGEVQTTEEAKEVISKKTGINENEIGELTEERCKQLLTMWQD